MWSPSTPPGFENCGPWGRESPAGKTAAFSPPVAGAAQRGLRVPGSSCAQKGPKSTRRSIGVLFRLAWLKKNRWVPLVWMGFMPHLPDPFFQKGHLCLAAPAPTWIGPPPPPPQGGRVFGKPPPWRPIFAEVQLFWSSFASHKTSIC